MGSPGTPGWFCHRENGQRRLGLVVPEPERRFLDAGPADVVALLHQGGLDAADLRARIATATPLDAPPVFDVPIDRPGKILCLGKNFAKHAAEFGAEVPDEPIFFTKLPDTLLPHKGTVLLGAENRGIHGLEPRLEDGVWTVRVRWHQEEVALDMSSAVVNGDLLYGFSHYDSGRIFCLDINTGKILWQGPARTGENVAFLAVP